MPVKTEYKETKVSKNNTCEACGNSSLVLSKLVKTTEDKRGDHKKMYYILECSNCSYSNRDEITALAEGRLVKKKPAKPEVVETKENGWDKK